MGRLTRGYRVRRLREDSWSERPDTLVVEEPLEIWVGWSYAVTMRAPGGDFDLAVTLAGFVRENGMNVYAHPHRVIG